MHKIFIRPLLQLPHTRLYRWRVAPTSLAFCQSFLLRAGGECKVHVQCHTAAASCRRWV